MNERLWKIRQILITAGIIVAVILLIVFNIFNIIGRSRASEKSNARFYAEKAASNISSELGARIEGEFSGLEKTVLEAAGAQDDSAALSRALKESRRNRGLGRLMIIDNAGRLLASSETADMAGLAVIAYENEGFSRAVSGSAYISDINSRLTRKAGEVSVLLFAPYYSGGEIKGAIVDILPASELSSLIAMREDVEGGHVWALRSDGGSIISPLEMTEEDQAWINDNLFSSELKSLPDELYKGRSGVIEYKANMLGSPEYVAYSSAGSTNWSVVCAISSKHVRALSGSYRNVLSNFIGIISGVLIIALLYLLFTHILKRKRDRRSQNIDQLTGIFDKGAFENYLELNKDKLDGYAALLLDITDFKKLNHTLGYGVGNKTIRIISDTIQRQLEKGEYVYRGAGARFIILLRVGDKENAESRVKALIEELASISITDGGIEYTYKCSYNCGVYMLTGKDETVEDVEDVLVLTLAKAKKDAGCQYAFYDEEMAEKLVQRRALVNSVESAMQENQIKPYFQPKYDIDSKKVTGAEVLARWFHPEFGVILPDDFVPILELKGYISQLDLYMLEEACKMVKKWLGEEHIPVPISVNMSKINIKTAGFVDKVEEITQKFMVPTSLIELEFDEDVYNNATPEVIEALNKLHDLGFVLTEDGFGDKGISIAGVCRLPVDTIKLSRKIQLEALEDKKLRYAIYIVLTAIKKMDIDIVFEGVEIPEQEELVRALKCSTAYGLLYSEPLSPEEFEKAIF